MAARSQRLVLLLVPLLLAGCVGSPQPDATPVAAASLVDPWTGDREELVHVQNAGMGYEFDVLCRFGGGVEHERSDGRVWEGTDRIEVTVRSTPATTGVQVGYSLDGGEVTWLPAGDGVHTLDVAPDQAETPDGPLRWAFHHQMNIPLAPQDCYTGFSTGGYSFLIEAVRGS